MMTWYLHITKLLTIVLLLSSCLGPPKKKWSQKRYKLMLWDFAASLEKNYNQLDTSPELDSEGKRKVKSIYHHSKIKKKGSSSSKSYLKKIKQDSIYDPEEHKDQN